MTETADYLGVTEPAVRAWISDSTLPAHRIGRCVRLRLDEIDAAMAAVSGSDA